MSTNTIFLLRRWKYRRSNIHNCKIKFYTFEMTKILHQIIFYIDLVILSPNYSFSPKIFSIRRRAFKNWLRIWSWFLNFMPEIAPFNGFLQKEKIFLYSSFLRTVIFIQVFLIYNIVGESCWVFDGFWSFRSAKSYDQDGWQIAMITLQQHQSFEEIQTYKKEKKYTIFQLNFLWFLSILFILSS